MTLLSGLPQGSPANKASYTCFYAAQAEGDGRRLARCQDERGFTLIELMVVVLIMGILMAIAIPTFLSTKSNANDAAAKSDATNTFTNEKAYYADNQVFLSATNSSGGSTLDTSTPWGASYAGLTTANITRDALVYASASTSGSTQSVVVAAVSKSGNCYYIGDTEPGGYVGYAESTGGCVATLPSAPTAAATAGGAGAHSVASSGSISTWYTSW